MCIICNCGDDGDEFLSAFASARIEMKRAKEAMLKCSQVATTTSDRAKYDTTHKAMARLIREWNRLEESRESGHGG